MVGVMTRPTGYPISGERALRDQPRVGPWQLSYLFIAYIIPLEKALYKSRFYYNLPRFANFNKERLITIS